jgi:hypothetical protein
MPDEQKPEGSEGPPPAQGEAPKPPAKPAAPAAKPAPPKPAAPAPKPPAVITSTYLGQNFIVAKPEAAIPILEYLKLEADFDYLVDITAVDWPKRPERFDLVYIVYSFPRNERVRIKTHIPDGYKPAPPWACT